jgi:hypothetical protein
VAANVTQIKRAIKERSVAPNISKMMERSHLLDIATIISYDLAVSSAEDDSATIDRPDLHGRFFLFLAYSFLQ